MRAISLAVIGDPEVIGVQVIGGPLDGRMVKLVRWTRWRALWLRLHTRLFRHAFTEARLRDTKMIGCASCPCPEPSERAWYLGGWR